MTQYILQRLALIVPTLLGIMLINFAIIQAAPGGPIERAIAQAQAMDVAATARMGGHAGMETAAPVAAGDYRGAVGLDPQFIAQLEKHYGFDKPPVERFLAMLGNYLTFNFGNSFYQDRPVIDIIVSKLPVSISLGLWSTLIIYLISIPLGIRKAVQDGSRFDVWTSTLVIIGYAIPAYLFAMLLIVLFAGGSYWQFFPLRGLTSDGFHLMPWYEQILDYLWHLALPVTAMVIGGFAGLTMLAKNSFLEEIRKAYTLTARAKGATPTRVLYGHVFRNAMLIIIAGFPAAFIGIFFTGSVLIEVMFSLDGLGLLGFEAAITRDYPVMFGTLFMFTLLGLILSLISDLTYVLVDPRIDFGKRG
jgi:microcin C transport system permease protein